MLFALCGTEAGSASLADRPNHGSTRNGHYRLALKALDATKDEQIGFPNDKEWRGVVYCSQFDSEKAAGQKVGRRCVYMAGPPGSASEFPLRAFGADANSKRWLQCGKFARSTRCPRSLPSLPA